MMNKLKKKEKQEKFRLGKFFFFFYIKPFSSVKDNYYHLISLTHEKPKTATKCRKGNKYYITYETLFMKQKLERFIFFCRER